MGFRVVQLVPTPSTAMREIFSVDVELTLNKVLVPVDDVMAALTDLGLSRKTGKTAKP